MTGVLGPFSPGVVCMTTDAMPSTTLGRSIGMSIKSAGELLEQFVAADIAIEVSHRSARQLSGLKGMAPVRGAATAPR